MDRRLPYDTWFWVCLLHPWVVAVVVCIAQVIIDRTWPVVIWSLSSAAVFIVISLRIVLIRRKISAHLSVIDRSDLAIDVSNKSTKVLARWKRFTQTGLLLALVTALVAIAQAYVLFSGSPNRTLSYSDPTTYTTKEAIVLIGSIINALILLTMLWYSWVPVMPKLAKGVEAKEIESNCQTDTRSSATRQSIASKQEHVMISELETSPSLTKKQERVSEQESSEAESTC